MNFKRILYIVICSHINTQSSHNYKTTTNKKVKLSLINYNTSFL